MLPRRMAAAAARRGAVPRRLLQRRHASDVETASAIRFRENDGEATYPHQKQPQPQQQALGGGEEAAGETALAAEKAGETQPARYVNPDRPKGIQAAGDGPLPLDFKPGDGTDIIDHHVDVHDRFYRPNTPASLETLVEHEKSREHLHIYRSRPEAVSEVWEGGVPRFVRSPMNMSVMPHDSRNPEMPPGPILHDTKTGVSIRILMGMTPSPEMMVQEDQMSAKLQLATARYFLFLMLFAFGFLSKFVYYMSLRTKARTQGIMNPVAPQHRIKVLEIIYLARNDFAAYKKYFNEFTQERWLPYRQSKLLQEASNDKEAAAGLQSALQQVEEKQAAQSQGAWSKVKGWFGLGKAKKAEEGEEAPRFEEVYIPQMKRSFQVDLSRKVMGMGPDGPVYASPDVEVLAPDQLEERIKSLRTKAVSQIEEETRKWSSESYDERARTVANDFILQFHGFLREKGAITPMDPEKVDQMYEVEAIPRLQNVGDEGELEGLAKKGMAVRPHLVHVV